MGTNRDHVIGLLQSRLGQIEQRFGGLQRGVPRRRVSPHDPRSRAELDSGGMQGGDRMLHHGYSAHYAQYLLPLQQRSRSGKGLTIVELGVLRGSGLALLCELFPKARVIGLDIDTSHFREHRGTLERLGAFRKGSPEVHEFDELSSEAPRRLAGILAGGKVDVFIHDALHYDTAILATTAHAIQHMKPECAMFFEDNATVGRDLTHLYGDRFAVARYGRLTVLWR